MPGARGRPGSRSVRRALRARTEAERRPAHAHRRLHRDHLVVAPDQAAGGAAARSRPSGPDAVALRYTEPDERSCSSTSDRMTITWPARGVKESATSARRSAASRSISSTDRPTSCAATSRSPRRRPSGRRLSHRDGPEAQADPGRADPARSDDRRTTLLMSAMRMTFPNGDTKVMTFTDVKLNPPLDPGAVQPRSS